MYGDQPAPELTSPGKYCALSVLAVIVELAKILLNDWINKNPADDNAKELLEEILQLESS